MERALELSKMVAASWSLEFNPHKAYYESARPYFGRDESLWDAVGPIDWDADIWELSAYPHTPVAFIRGVSNDLEALIEWAIRECR